MKQISAAHSSQLDYFIDRVLQIAVSLNDTCREGSWDPLRIRMLNVNSSGGI